MRIHLFAAHYPSSYKTYYDTQFSDLLEAGHEITVFALEDPRLPLNEKVVRYGLRRRTRIVPPVLRKVPLHLGSMLRTVLARPSAALRAIRSVGAGASAKGRVLNVARALSSGLERPDLCLVHGLGTAMSCRWLRAAYPGVPLAMYYHGGEVPSVSPIDDTDAGTVFRSMDIVFTNTEFSRDHAVARGCPADRIVILPVGFDLRDFQPAAPRSYRRGGTLRLLSAGRMSEEKGFGYALEALTLLRERGIRNVHYSLTGEGYLRPRLEEYVREHGLQENVAFLGTITTDQVIEAMGATDVLVLPSIQVGNWVENQACAVQEAMLMGALVVTTRTGGVPESIPEAMRPYSVPPADAVALADAIEAIHRSDDTRLAQLGGACRAFVVEHYDIRKLNRRMLELATQPRDRGSRAAGSPPALAASAR